jgi:hypothetical protein
VEEQGDRVVNLVKWREFQEWLGRKCMRGLEKFEREGGGDEREVTWLIEGLVWG